LDVNTAAAEAPTTDADLVRATLAGDRAKFEVLVRRHNQRLYRACRAVLGDDAEAEDAVQAAWIAGFRHLATFRGDAAFGTWMTRIAVHEASARLKKKRPFVAVEEVEVRDPQDPEEDAIAEEIGRVLEREVDTLPAGMRAVLVLRDVLELDTAETAAALGITDEAVRVRLHRARSALASSLLAHGVPQLWRFDGARCDRITANVMNAIAG
jgi:RNA polymerase sigma-70 factor (ECF subfamily)